MCRSLNQSVSNDITTIDALKRILTCEDVPYGRFLEVLSRMVDRFSVLEQCIKLSIPPTSELLSTNLSIVAHVQRFAQFPHLSQKWETIKNDCFTIGNLNALRNLGLSLVTRFPLKRLTDVERVKLIERLKAELSSLGTGVHITTAERSLQAALETLVFMLERYAFFGVMAVRRRTEETLMQAQFLRQRTNDESEKAKCERVVALTSIMLESFGVDAPINLGNAFASVAPLPDRLRPAIMADLPTREFVTIAASSVTLALPGRAEPTEGSG
jgi:hypothetical protein